MSTKTGKQARRNKEIEGTDYFLYIAAVAVASKASQKPFKSAVLSVSRRGGSSFGFLKSCQRAKKLMIVIVMSLLGSRIDAVLRVKNGQTHTPKTENVFLGKVNK